MANFALLLIVLFYFALASRRFVQSLRRFNDNRFLGGMLIALLIVPYVLVALPNNSSEAIAFLDGLARMAGYLFLPGLALLFRSNRNKPLDLFDLVAILGVWLPVEFNWLPEADVRFAGINLPIPMLTAICLGFLLFQVIRPLEQLGYTYRLKFKDVGFALLGLAGFSLVGLPLGIGMGFIRPGVISFDALNWLLSFLAIYFLNALPEELLFRGVIQNLLEQRLAPLPNGRNWGTVIASIIFGLAHINNTTAFHHPPNWPYVIMATLAGLAYGYAWRKSEKITASAITHTGVNFIWGVIFRA